MELSAGPLVGNATKLFSYMPVTHLSAANGYIMVHRGWCFSANPVLTREPAMLTKTVYGEARSIYGKQVIPVVKSFQVGSGGGPGNPAYGFAYIRPAGFIVEEAGVRQRVTLPSIVSPLGLLCLSAVALPLATLVWRKASRRRAEEENEG